MKNTGILYHFIVLIFFAHTACPVFSQAITTDSTKSPRRIPKLEHAEPLFNDLVRDLGARRGEQELNLGFGMTGNENYFNYTCFVEYEFAPVNRLGIEIEIPFSFYTRLSSSSGYDVPDHRMESLKMALQYTFWVSPAYGISMAAGYMNELEPVSFNRYGKGNFFKGNMYRPFLVAAKNWNRGFHTLLMTGPVLEHDFASGQLEWSCMLNLNFHYMIPGSRSFVGLEMDNELYPSGEKTQITLRPQVRLALHKSLLIGIVAGLPVMGEDKQFSFFTRLIYEPPLWKKRRKK